MNLDFYFIDLAFDVLIDLPVCIYCYFIVLNVINKEHIVVNQ